MLRRKRNCRLFPARAVRKKKKSKAILTSLAYPSLLYPQESHQPVHPFCAVVAQICDLVRSQLLSCLSLTSAPEFPSLIPVARRYEESDGSDVDEEEASDDEVEEVAAGNGPPYPLMAKLYCFFGPMLTILPAPPASKKRKTTSEKKDAPEEVDDDEEPEAVDDDDEDVAAAPGEEDDDDDDDAEEEEAQDTATKGGPAAAAKKAKGAQVPKEDDLEAVKGLGDEE